MRIEFTVIGTPQPGGSKKGYPMRGADGKMHVAIVDVNAKAKPWKACVAAAAREAYDGPLLRGALIVQMVFCRKRPKGHYRTGKNSHLLKDSAPIYPTTRPDVLKLARSTEDALTGVIWEDDSQTVDLKLAKRYGEPERAEIVIVGDDG